MKPITFYSPKGGQGCSTVAATTAMIAAKIGQRVRLVDHCGELAAVMGLPEYDDGERVTFEHWPLTLERANTYADMPTDPDTLEIHDMGTLATVPADHTRLMVVRPCYLALRRAVQRNDSPSAIVLMAEPDRALGATDVRHALGAPVVATVPVQPAIARRIDAGLFAPTNLPMALHVLAIVLPEMVAQ